MGQAVGITCKKMCAADQSCIQYWLLPKRAPEWYRKLVMGISGDDVHLQDPPADSLKLLGHISLTVPKMEDTKIYYVDGIGLGESQREDPGQLRANLGPSQLRLANSGNSAPERWPGEICFWVEDIRSTADTFNMLGRTLGVDMVAEMKEATTGGEYAMKLHDPGHMNFVVVSEAPFGWAEKLRAIHAEPSKHELEFPVKTKNALALVDAVVVLPDREKIEGAARFYEHFFGTVPTKKYQVYEAQARMDVCIVHFAPAACLHQTLTYKCEKGSQIPSSIGLICIYLANKSRFHLTYAKAKRFDILSDACKAKTWEQIETACEFEIAHVFDPQHASTVLPLRHLVRFSQHPECPLHEPVAGK